jgi:hypothetical protein
MYLLGNQQGKPTKKTARKPIKVSTDNVTLIPAIYDESEELQLNK